MTLGAYKYVNELWKKKQSDLMRFLLRIRAWEYRNGDGLVRRPRPSRPQRAHQLGYKSKEGFFIYRARVTRGGRKKPLRKGINFGKPTNAGIRVTNRRNLQVMAEARAGRKLGSGIRILNSYWVGQDAKYKYYEIICVDPFHTAIRVDPEINWIALNKHKRREARGKTSAGRKHRGLRVKGQTAHKVRPSRRAVWNRQNRLKLSRKR